MNTDAVIQSKIEQAFRSRPWRGLISVEEAMADAVRYRQSLNEADRQLYDAQILAGRHPAKALETVEIVFGRDEPHGSQREDKPIAIQ